MKPEARLLVVDDETSIRHFLVRMLERAGYEVIAASNGAEALALLQQVMVDLLLTDIRMDQLDGVALLREVRARYPDIAVLLLTGHATVDSAVAALRHGALNYLLKPVRNEEIISAVRAALETRAHQQRQKQLEQLAQQVSQVIDTDTGSFTHAPTFEQTSGDLTCGAITLDLNSYNAYLADETLALTPTEFRLLTKFVQTPGTVFDYVELVRDACGYLCARHEAQEIINTHIRNLRQKLDVAPGEPLYVESVRGVGYRLIAPDR